MIDPRELFAPRPHKVHACPRCGGKLGHDPHPYTSETGHIFRARLCESCGAETHTKQGPEEITP